MTTTPLEELGEFGLIKHLTQAFENKQITTTKGVGDDAAVLNLGETQLLITTDMLVEGIHFNLMYAPLKYVGYKAVTSNLSDICAMNGTPTQITVSIAVSSKYSVEALTDLYQGIQEACQAYNVDLVGGDTTSSATGMTVSVTAIGTASARKVVYRNGAKINDLVCVTGDLGGGYMGLQVLEREKEVFQLTPDRQPDLTKYTYILQRQMRPEARTDLKGILQDLTISPTAMIDISDGLSSELLHICGQSEVGCAIYEDKIPIDKCTKETAIEMHLNPLTAALNGGEDYELLFTVPLGDFDKIKTHPDISVIGHITEAAKGTNLIIPQTDETMPLTAQGFKHL